MRAGEQRAFDEFFDASAARLMALVERRTQTDTANAEDVVQSALIKAVQNLQNYRGEAALFTWLARICLHELADVQRKVARLPALVSLSAPRMNADTIAELRLPEEQEPLPELDAAIRNARVLQILAVLPDRYSQILEAKYGDGLSVEDIARRLHLTTIAVQSLLARARDAFRERWLAASTRSEVTETRT